MSRKFPLEPLRRKRADEVERQTRAFGEAERELERARAESSRQSAAQAALESRLRDEADRERKRLERGELRAADLCCAAWFDVGAEVERKAAARRSEQARARQEQIQALAHARQATLARASADAEVVEHRHVAWERAREHARVTREEAAAEEAHLARTRRKVRP